MKKTSFKSFSQAHLQFGLSKYREDVFADGLTPIQMFQIFKETAAFLLESSDAESEWSNYSFIGLKPIYECKEDGGQYTTVSIQTNEVIVKADSFDECYKQTVQFLNPEPSGNDIPFQGGAVGYISYEAVREMEPILNKTNKGYEGTKRHFIICEQILALNEKTKELSLIQHVESDGCSAKDAYHYAKTAVKQLISTLEHPPPSSLLPLNHVSANSMPVTSNYTKQGYIDAVQIIKEYIQAGDIFQAVLSQRLQMNVTVTGFDLYRVLRYINPSPYMFYIKVGQKELIGSSPEKLVAVVNGHVEVHPIAGTRKRGETKEEDDNLANELLEDQKERAEHHMLVDLARNDVGKVSSYGSVEVPTFLEIGKFSHVMHLVSKVTGKLERSKTAADALKAAFPAGTLSGAPKIRAMQILDELEPTSRGIYGGAICYLDFNGNMDSCIAIRTIVLESGTATIQAGAGIVSDSDPESEYEETLNKAKALIRAIEQTEAMFGAGVVQHD